VRVQTHSVTVTPPRPIPLAGYAGRTLAWERIDSPLSVELIRLQDEGGNQVTIGSIDTLFVGPRFVEDLRRRLGASAMAPVLLFASHTHNAPSIVPEMPRLGECDDDWYQALLDVVASGIHALVASRPKDVTIAYGAAATDLNVNRRLPAHVFDYRGLLAGRPSLARRIAAAPNPDGVIDKTVHCIFLEDDAGEVLAVLWCFAAHAAFFPARHAVSPDYPGAVRDLVKQRFGPDCAVIFLPGFAGSAIPRIPFSLPRSLKELTRRCLPFYPILPSFQPAGFRAWVRALHSNIESAYLLRSRAPGQDEHLAIRSSSAKSIFSREAGGEGRSDIDLELRLIQITKRLGILACNGEILGECEPLLGTFPQPVVVKTGYLSGQSLYVPTSRQLAEGGYEVDGFKEYFCLCGSFHPDITQLVQAAARKLAVPEAQ